MTASPPVLAQVCNFPAEIARVLEGSRPLAAHISRLEACLAASPDALNAHDDNGETALLMAARVQNAAMVAQLLAFGADPNVAGTDWRRRTPLGTAIDNYFGEDPAQLQPTLDALLAAGGNVNYASDVGESPIQIAASRLDGVWFVDYLLTAGADPLAADSLGNPALFWTVAFQCNIASGRALYAAHGDAWRVDDEVVTRLRDLATNQCATRPGGPEFIAEVFY